MLSFYNVTTQSCMTTLHARHRTIGSILHMKHSSIKTNQPLNANYAFHSTTEVKRINPNTQFHNIGLSKKMDGIWNRYNLKSTGRIYTFCVLKCSEKFKVLDLP